MYPNLHSLKRCLRNFSPLGQCWLNVSSLLYRTQFSLERGQPRARIPHAFFHLPQIKFSAKNLNPVSSSMRNNKRERERERSRIYNINSCELSSSLFHLFLRKKKHSDSGTSCKESKISNCVSSSIRNNKRERERERSRVYNINSCELSSSLFLLFLRKKKHGDSGTSCKESKISNCISSSMWNNKRERERESSDI